jgi:hypothetical protein
MFDLPYILSHPLIKKIVQKCAELEEEAMDLPEGSERRRSIEKRLGKLEQYKLPKPDATDLEQSVPIFNQWGQKIGNRHSLRRRFVEKRRGRPELHSIAVRAALEEKLADPRLTWPALAEKFGFKDKHDLERAVRQLKILLRREGILPLIPEDVQDAGRG